MVFHFPSNKSPALPCPGTLLVPWEAALALKKLSDQPLLSTYLILSTSDQTQIGFFNYSFSVLQISFSSHNLLPLGYKADQIFPIPTTATTITKTKNLLACWFPLKPSCFCTFPLKICIELLLPLQSTQPFNWGRDCLYHASVTKGHQWLARHQICFIPHASLPRGPHCHHWPVFLLQPSPTTPALLAPCRSGCDFFVSLVDTSSSCCCHVPQSPVFCPLSFYVFLFLHSLPWQSDPCLNRTISIKYYAQDTVWGTADVMAIIILSKSWQTRGGNPINKWLNTLY